MTYPQITPAAARVNAGLNQKEAANELQISLSTLQNYESGASVPSWDMVKKMEKLYGFPSDFIFFGEELRFKRKNVTV